MNRIAAVDSHERDRSQRGSVAFGLGYALTRRTTLSFDLAGGSVCVGRPDRGLYGALLQTPSRTAASLSATPPYRAILRAGCFSPRRS
jgi:hypothetical protein